MRFAAYLQRGCLSVRIILITAASDEQQTSDALKRCAGITHVLQ